MLEDIGGADAHEHRSSQDAPVDDLGLPVPSISCLTFATAAVVSRLGHVRSKGLRPDPDQEYFVNYLFVASSIFDMLLKMRVPDMLSH